MSVARALCFAQCMLYVPTGCPVTPSPQETHTEFSAASCRRHGVMSYKACACGQWCDCGGDRHPCGGDRGCLRVENNELSPEACLTSCLPIARLRMHARTPMYSYARVGTCKCVVMWMRGHVCVCVCVCVRVCVCVYTAKTTSICPEYAVTAACACMYAGVCAFGCTFICTHACVCIHVCALMHMCVPA